MIDNRGLIYKELGPVSIGTKYFNYIIDNRVWNRRIVIEQGSEYIYLHDIDKYKETGNLYREDGAKFLVTSVIEKKIASLITKNILRLFIKQTNKQLEAKGNEVVSDYKELQPVRSLYNKLKNDKITFDHFYSKLFTSSNVLIIRSLDYLTDDPSEHFVRIPDLDYFVFCHLIAVTDNILKYVKEYLRQAV